MATGLCTAAVTLTAEEIARLEELPDAANLVEEADGCQFRAGHREPHVHLVQVQDAPDGTSKFWWVRWDGPPRPDSTGYAIVCLPPCLEQRGPDGCRHPAGHEDEHRFD